MYQSGSLIAHMHDEIKIFVAFGHCVHQLKLQMQPKHNEIG